MIRKRLQALVLGTALSLTVGAGAAQLDDDQLLAAMISTVVAHDVAIIAGVAPLPAVQYTAETVEYVANLGLKAYRPWLKPPANLTVYAATGTEQNSTYTANGCDISFNLFSAQAGYENLFGVANFRDSYFDDVSKTNYPWKSSDLLGTRWGFLQAPQLYHANSSVALSVESPYEAQRFDPATGLLGEPYFPIDTAASGPQTVFLPIGHHTIEWRAATELNWISDVAIPGILLGIGLLSELKNVYGGASVAKQVKGTGIADSIVDEALDPQGAKRLSDGVKKFENIWQSAFKKRQKAKRNKMLRKIVFDIKCKLSSAIIDVLNETVSAGIDTLGERTAAELVSAGVLNKSRGDLLHAIYQAQLNTRKDLAISVIMLSVGCDDKEDFIASVVEILLDTVGVASQFTTETKVSRVGQLITVLDNVPPTIAFDPAPLVIEASDFGGTRLGRAYPQLLAIAEDSSSDNCGRRPSLHVDGPELLPLGLTELTWTATDKGPNPNDGQDYSPSATQTILVRDTQPPLLLAPPSKVIESAVNLGLTEAAIGSAVAVDLADVQPTIINDAPTEFTVDRRTRIEWTATDLSGNSAKASQQITVKTPGTNSVPVATDTFAQTLTAQPVDIRLSAMDADVLDGVSDPLWFKIDALPAHGEFIAPLYPFFIEDYRTGANDGLGEDFDPISDEIYSYVGNQFCDTNLPRDDRVPPRNFVHEAKFVHVTDAGTRYVLDEFFVCDQFDSRATTQGRFSQWSPSGEFIGQAQIGSSPEDLPLDGTFVVDKDGFLYFYNATERGSSSNELRLKRCNADWTSSPDTDTSQQCTDSYKFDSSSAPGNALDARSLHYARIDSQQNVAYVADNFGVHAFELLESQGTRYLGELGPANNGTVIDGWIGSQKSLEVGSDGSLYVADADNHRIHKIAALAVDDTGGQVPGDYIGWSGRCTGSGNKACDVDLQRSRGYSCTFEADSCTVEPANRSGSAQGQFNRPLYIAIDPNDVLYIADYENERIQRLSPDGSFAGEAVSDGSGINKGDRPSFVLGNIGKPESVSVNSSQFFVVDRDERFVHVFGTLPFKDITDNAATVTYVSDQAFPNPNDSGNDQFRFSVTDGLARSNSATVTITVNRNFRAPIALEETFTTNEDLPLDLTLPADDPDGIAGKDFLGLDTLTYTIVSGPEHGELSGSDADRVYTPNLDFYGDDSFVFRVNDGRDDSNEATISITVVPDNDPPVVSIDPPEQVALGFPTTLTARFTDDPSDSYEGVVTWGDGMADVTGEIVDAEGEDPRLEGLLITDPPAPGIEGQAFAQHVFESAGLHTVRVCLTDSGGLPGCDSIDIVVEPLVSLGFGGVAYDTPLEADEITRQEINDGVAFTYEMTVENGEPSVGTGMTAEAVALDVELPASILIGDVQISQGSCALDQSTLACTMGDIAPGETVTLTVAARGPGNLIYNADAGVTALLSTSTAALESELEPAIYLDLVADTTDSDSDGMSDVYEITYGLNPAFDDSLGDADGDGIDNATEYEIGTSPQNTDSDGDGLPDFDEYSGGITDPANADSDDDGMPDGWEIDNGFNPAYAGDGLEDSDGDGRRNAEEFELGTDPFSDDVSPVIDVPADIEVEATGQLTNVDLGTVSANDARDGPIAAVASRSGPFRPGRHAVTWQATDAAGNVGEAVQFVNVAPRVNFAVDQQRPEGIGAKVSVELNGPAARYPVSVAYSVSGSATNPDDHNASSGTVTIADGTHAVIDIDLVKDAFSEPDETVVLTMGSISNAVAGEKTAHTIVISDLNARPSVDIKTEQNGFASSTVGRGDGDVAVIADVLDDPADTHVFDWSGSDSGVFEPATSSDPSYLLDPASLGSGTYRLQVQVLDNGVPVADTVAQSFLKIAELLPALNPADDSDGDGIDDATEGWADSDLDRVPDFLDSIPNSNAMHLDDSGRTLETNTGLKLRLGETAFRGGARYPRIVEDELEPDVDYGYLGDLIDFEVAGLTPGGKAQIVVPLSQPVSAGATYRKFVAGSWRELVIDQDNGIATAPGSNGVCPPPAHTAYHPGLGLGHGCLQLTLTDGGPNDADQLADGVIRDPGGLAVPVAVSVEVVPVDDVTTNVDGEFVLLRLRLHTDSGDVMLRSLSLSGNGSGDERTIDSVKLLHDVNGNGEVDSGEPVLASGSYESDNGELTLSLSTDLELPLGSTDILVTYQTASN